MGKIIKTLIVLIFIAIAALVGILLTTDINQYKTQIVQLVKDATGRDFQINGELKMSASLIPTIAVEEVSLGNTSWGKEKNMLNAGKFEAQIALLPLLKKEIQINRIILTDANIHLEKNKAGIGNWVFTSESKSKSKQKQDITNDNSSSTSNTSLNINQFIIKNSQITYIDELKKTTEKLDINKFKGSLSKTIDIMFDIQYNNMPISASGSFGSINNLKNNTNFPVNIDLSMNNIDLHIEGAIKKPTEAKGIDLHLSAKMDSFSSVSEIIKKDLPSVGPIEISGRFSEKDGNYILDDFKTQIDKTTINGNAIIKDIKKFKGIALNINLNSPSLADLNQLTEMNLPDMKPLSFYSHITDDNGSYQLKDLNVQTGNIKAGGDILINLSGERPALTANLLSEQLDLVPFMLKEKQDNDTQTQTQTQKKQKIFSSDPLPLDGLKKIDANLDLKINTLITKDMTFDGFELNLNLQNGKLILEQKGKTAGGTVLTNLDLDTSSGERATLNHNIEIKQIELGQIPKIKQKNLISGSKSDISIKLKSSGKSVSDIMSGANGKLLIKIGQGKILDSMLNKAGTDVLLSTLSLLNPDVKKQDDITLECAVVNFDINDGIATANNGIGILTSQINILGGGTVNFKTEELDIGIAPKAREGIGINLGQLAELVRLGGTLANPTPKADVKAALKTGLSTGAAIATGGLSLLAEGLLDKTSNTNPCDTALGIRTNKQQTPEKKKQTTETVTELPGAIGDKIKGLFGN